MKIMAKLYANGVFSQGLYITHNKQVREFFDSMYIGLADKEKPRLLVRDGVLKQLLSAQVLRQQFF